jgi:hypothetical protein
MKKMPHTINVEHDGVNYVIYVTVLVTMLHAGTVKKHAMLPEIATQLRNQNQVTSTKI